MYEPCSDANISLNQRFPKIRHLYIYYPDNICNNYYSCIPKLLDLHSFSIMIQNISIQNDLFPLLLSCISQLHYLQITNFLETGLLFSVLKKVTKEQLVLDLNLNVPLINNSQFFINEITKTPLRALNLKLFDFEIAETFIDFDKQNKTKIRNRKKEEKKENQKEELILSFPSNFTIYENLCFSNTLCYVSFIHNQYMDIEEAEILLKLIQRDCSSIEGIELGKIILLDNSNKRIFGIGDDNNLILCTKSGDSKNLFRKCDGLINKLNCIIPVTLLFAIEDGNIVELVDRYYIKVKLVTWECWRQSTYQWFDIYTNDGTIHPIQRLNGLQKSINQSKQKYKPTYTDPLFSAWQYHQRFDSTVHSSILNNKKAKEDLEMEKNMQEMDDFCL